MKKPIGYVTEYVKPDGKGGYDAIKVSETNPLPVDATVSVELSAGTNYIGKVRRTDGTTDESFATSIQESSGAGIGGLTICSAGAAGIKNRIFEITLTCDVNCKITLDQGFGTYYYTGSPIVLKYGVIGKLQTNTATAITATTDVPANLGVLVTYSQE